MPPPFVAQASFSATAKVAVGLDPDDAIFQNPDFARGLREDVATLRRNAMNAGVPVSHMERADGKEYLVTLGRGGVTLSRRELAPVDFAAIAQRALEGLTRRRANRLSQAQPA